MTSEGVFLIKRTRTLEFWLVVAVSGIIVGFLLLALLRAEEQAERLVVEATVRNMNSGLRWKEAELMTQGRENERPALLQENPVRWLEKPPTGYREIDRVVFGGVEAGRWVWDRTRKRLYYRPRYATGLHVVGGGDVLEWRVAAAGDVNALRPGTLRVEAVSVYEWKP